MESVFNLLLAVLSDMRELALMFKISAYGFEFTLWHFWIALIVVSIFLPFFFKFSASSPLVSIVESAGTSERTSEVSDDEFIGPRLPDGSKRVSENYSWLYRR